jgi:hypothetical protein
MIQLLLMQETDHADYDDHADHMDHHKSDDRSQDERFRLFMYFRHCSLLEAI